jgi:hypothetical protein
MVQFDGLLCSFCLKKEANRERKKKDKKKKKNDGSV